MSIESLKYRDWKFDYDKEKTAEFYKQVVLSGSEICNCGNCKYFTAIKDQIYPNEVKELFIKLGVDINKEFEVCDYGDEENGHIYSWWIHFIGKITQGKDCSKPFADGNGYTIEHSKINENVKIGFTSKISSSFFENKDLVEIRLFAEMPWKDQIINNTKG